jgi:septum formation protein
MAAELILASTSAARRSLLTAAGLSFRAIGSGVDEAAIKQTFAGRPPAEIARRLAREKAETVSRIEPLAIVIGADQVLDLDGTLFDKPSSVEEAREQLLRLRGRTHLLHSAVAIARAGGPLAGFVGVARLTMRPFTEQFLDGYLRRMGDRVTSTVGGYEIEGAGHQLFEAVDGDHTTILGLPMLPLLEVLRRHDLLER